MDISLASVVSPFVDNFVLDEEIHQKINAALDCITVETEKAVKSRQQDVAGSVEREFDRVMNKANTSLEDVLVRFSDVNHQLSMSSVNAAINRVQIGGKLIDDTGNAGIFFNLMLALADQVYVSVCRVRRTVESSGIKRLSLNKALNLLIKLENSYQKLLTRLEDLLERIEIHDALTEKHLTTCGIPELDALNKN